MHSLPLPLNGCRTAAKTSLSVWRTQATRRMRRRLPRKLSRIMARKAVFLAAMDDDFNTANAIAVLFEITRDINTLLKNESVSADILRTLLGFYDELLGLFGFLPEEKTVDGDAEIESARRRTHQSKKRKGLSESGRTPRAPERNGRDAGGYAAGHEMEESVMPRVRLSETSPLALAYMGDAVFAVLRPRKTRLRGRTSARRLNRLARGYVTAVAQSAADGEAACRCWTKMKPICINAASNAKSAHAPRSAGAVEYRRGHRLGMSVRLSLSLRWNRPCTGVV